MTAVVDATSQYCKVTNWNPTDGIGVGCFTTAGAPVDTGFFGSFVGS